MQDVPNTQNQERLNATDILAQLAAVLVARKEAYDFEKNSTKNIAQNSEDNSYVLSLYRKGIDKILKKVGEEATEVVIAAKDVAQQNTSSPSPEAINALIYETADLWFHSLVMLAYFDQKPDAVLNELARRFGLSGLTEKAARPSND